MSGKRGLSFFYKPLRPKGKFILTSHSRLTSWRGESVGTDTQTSLDDRVLIKLSRKAKAGLEPLTLMDKEKRSFVGSSLTST